MQMAEFYAWKFVVFMLVAYITIYVVAMVFGKEKKVNKAFGKLLRGLVEAFAHTVIWILLIPRALWRAYRAQS